MQNPQNGVSCMVITTCNGKVLTGPSMGNPIIDDVVEFDKEAEKTV